MPVPKNQNIDLTGDIGPASGDSPGRCSVMIFSFFVGLTDVFVAGFISPNVQAAVGFVTQLILSLSSWPTPSASDPLR